MQVGTVAGRKLFGWQQRGGDAKGVESGGGIVKYDTGPHCHAGKAYVRCDIAMSMLT
jgi:hypothetical protein